MFCQYKLDSDDDLKINFDDLLKKIIEPLKAKKKLVNIVQVEKENQEVENLVKKYNH